MMENIDRAYELARASKINLDRANASLARIAQTDPFIYKLMLPRLGFLMERQDDLEMGLMQYNMRSRSLGFLPAIAVVGIASAVVGAGGLFSLLWTHHEDTKVEADRLACIDAQTKAGAAPDQILAYCNGIASGQSQSIGQQAMSIFKGFAVGALGLIALYLVFKYFTGRKS